MTPELPVRGEAWPCWASSGVELSRFVRLFAPADTVHAHRPGKDCLDRLASGAATLAQPRQYESDKRLVRGRYWRALAAAAGLMVAGLIAFFKPSLELRDLKKQRSGLPGRFRLDRRCCGAGQRRASLVVGETAGCLGAAGGLSPWRRGSSRRGSEAIAWKRGSASILRPGDPRALQIAIPGHYVDGDLERLGGYGLGLGRPSSGGLLGR